MAKIPPQSEPDNSPDEYIRRQLAPGARTRRLIERWLAQGALRALRRGRAISPQQRARIIDFLHQGREEAFCRAWLEGLDRAQLRDLVRNVLAGVHEGELIATVFGTRPPGRPPADSPPPSVAPDERERVRQSRPEATTGPPENATRPLRLEPEEARKSQNSAAQQPDLILPQKINQAPGARAALARPRGCAP
jgi:hypothetical protein